MIYADVDGNIGYQSPGRVPVRGKGDGAWPVPGWDPAYDWQGYLPFAELPSSFIPPQAERAMRPARMPRIDELPVPAQNQIRASRGEEPAQEHKPSLIQRS